MTKGVKSVIISQKVIKDVDNERYEEQKSDTKVSESEDGEFKTTSTGKAINSYTQSETESAENFVDEEG